MLRGRVAVIAVVDARGDTVWVWWVNTSMDPDISGARKTGAWELSRTAENFVEILDALLFDRMVVATEAGRAVVDAAGVTGFRWVDLDATRQEVEQIRDEYQQVFDVEQQSRTKSQQMRELQWPALPAPLDLENPPPAAGQNPEADVGRCLAIAAWVDQLVRAFEDIESAADNRSVLRDLYPARDFPAVVV